MCRSGCSRRRRRRAGDRRGGNQVQGNPRMHTLPFDLHVRGYHWLMIDWLTRWWCSLLSGTTGWTASTGGRRRSGAASRRQPRCWRARSSSQPPPGAGATAGRGSTTTDAAPGSSCLLYCHGKHNLCYWFLEACNLKQASSLYTLMSGHARAQVSVNTGSARFPRRRCQEPKRRAAAQGGRHHVLQVHRSRGRRVRRWLILLSRRGGSRHRLLCRPLGGGRLRPAATTITVGERWPSSRQSSCLWYAQIINQGSRGNSMLKELCFLRNFFGEKCLIQLGFFIFLIIGWWIQFCNSSNIFKTCLGA